MTHQPYVVVPPSAPEIPLLVSIPHTGVEVPQDIAARFSSAQVAQLPDTDWHLHRLYDFVPSLGAVTLHARFSRYVIDLNRPPDSAPLYPGRSETALVPFNTFANEPIYAAGAQPSPAEQDGRRTRYWQPYHDALVEQLARLKARFGYALLFDAHSILGFVPRFSPTPLPDLMLGDADHQSAHPTIGNAVAAVHQHSGYTWQRNNPFKGGYITRAYGRPQEHVHALQLEMSQRIYMQEGPPFGWDEALAQKLRPVLRRTLEAFVQSAAAVEGKTP